jgi:plasmid rolling circle replication initiator protein Rep
MVKYFDQKWFSFQVSEQSAVQELASYDVRHSDNT